MELSVEKDDFCSLPLPVALGLIWDVASQRLRELEKPRVARSPKYDDRFTKQKGKFCWLSEMSLDGLVWWRGRKAESAESGGQYADSDRKWIAKFDKWIEWRRLFPYEIWSGTRNEDRATAKPPSKDPEMHAWGPRAVGSHQEQKRDASPDDDGRSSQDDLDF